MKKLMLSTTMLLALSGNAFANWSAPVDASIPIPDVDVVIAQFGPSASPQIRVIVKNSGENPVIIKVLAKSPPTSSLKSPGSPVFVSSESIPPGGAIFLRLKEGNLIARGNVGPGKITIQFDGL